MLSRTRRTLIAALVTVSAIVSLPHLLVGRTPEIAGAWSTATKMLQPRAAFLQGGGATPPTYCAQTGAATLHTDKAHYAAGDVVQIAGSHYAPSCALTVVVTRPDGSWSGTDGTTDAYGNFTASYSAGPAQGVYRVDVTLGDPDPWTSTTFTSGGYIGTDSGDYAPGNPVTFSGGGWAPGETVSIVLDELDGPDDDVVLIAVADAAGNITNSQFKTDEHDYGVHFRAIATGQFSGGVARVEFADGFTATTRATGNWNANATWSITRTGSISTSTLNATVTGVGTNFLTELSIGDVITNTSDGVPLASSFIGTVASIGSNTSLTLTANANVTTSGIAWKARRVPAATDDAVFSAGPDVTVTVPASINSVNITAVGGSILTINASQSLSVTGAVSVTGNSTTNLITVDGILSAASLAITGGGNGTSIGRVNVDTGGSVLVSGAISVNANAGPAFLDLSSGSGTASAASLDLTASSVTGGRESHLDIGTGPVTVIGNLTTSACANLGSGDNHSNCFLTFAAAAGIVHIGGNLENDLSVTNFTTGGGSTIDFNGAGAGIIPATPNTFFKFQNLTVTKTGGAAATLAGSAQVNGGLTVNSGVLAGGGSLTLTLGGNVSNSGTIAFDGGAAGCGTTDLLLIRSTVTGTQRTWSGGGTFNITDVDAKDQAGSITAISSTDSGNNGWTFVAGCVVAPKLTVIKTVVGDTVGRFNLQINSTTYATNVGDTGSTGAQSGTVGSNTFGETGGTVPATSLADYTTVITGTGCTDNGNGTGSITLAAGDNKTCTITNTFKTPKLTVTKTVIGDTVGRFNLQINSTTYATNVGDTGTTGAQSGTVGSNTFGETGGTVPATSLADYTTVITGTGCTDNGNGTGSITLAAGDNKTCTITNTFKTPKLTVTKAVVGDTVGRFNLQINATTYATNVGDTGTTGDQSGTVGSNTFGETGGTVPATSLADYTTVITGTGCTDNGNGTGSITLAAGDNKTCTITNTFKTPKLTVTKTVIGDTVGRFNLQINSTTYATNVGNSGTTTAQNGVVGSNTFGETGGTVPVTSLADYTTVITGTGCTDNGNGTGSITLAAGDNKTCTITNTFKTPKLTLTKTVIGDTVGRFNLQINATTYATNVGNTGSTGAQNGIVGSNTFGETGGTVPVTSLADYTTVITGTGCTDNGNGTGSITLAAGDNKTCTITNTFKTPKLTVTKTVIGDTVGRFNLQINSTTHATNVGDTGSTGAQSGTVGSNTFGETGGTAPVTSLGDYTTVITGTGCTDNGNGTGSITLAAGDNKTCTITNTFKTPKLTVTKTVIGDSVGRFNLQINSTTYATNVGDTGSTGAQTGTVGSNTFGETGGTVPVTSLGDYTTVITGTGCTDNGNGTGTITLAVGDNKTCTITNTLKAAKLTVIKTVIGDTVGRFNLQINSTTYATNVGNNGTTNAQNGVVGSNTFGETGGTVPVTSLADYTTVITGTGCTDNGNGTGSITLAAGDNKTCTITNTFKTPKLTVTKTVIGDTVGRFNLQINSTTYATNVGNSGTTTAQNGVVGSNTFGETGGTVPVTSLSNYTTVISGVGCTDNGNGTGSITLAAGDNKTCTITNTFVSRPALTLAKSANPTTYSAALQIINYSYLVTNTGNVALAGPVTVADNKVTVTCPAVTTVGNLDAFLNPGEAITCAASYTVTAADVTAGSITNKATATAAAVNSNESTTTVLATKACETTPPTVSVYQTLTNPARVQLKVLDTGSGVASIVVIVSTNASTPVPAFAPGTKTAIYVTATKINPSAGSVVGLQVTDVCGNVTVFDPFDVTVNPGKREAITVTEVSGEESLVEIVNDDLTAMGITVNGQEFLVRDLKRHETRTISIASAMKPGATNTIILEARGPKGSSAVVTVYPPPVAPGSSLTDGERRGNSHKKATIVYLPQ